MSALKDLHICGLCKRVFNDIKVFLEHKSQCFNIPHDTKTESSSSQDVSLENGLFTSETVLDLSVLEDGSFPFVLQCDNEEVVSNGNHGENNSAQDHLNLILASNSIVDDINEEDVPNLLISQLSKEVVNKSHNSNEQTPEIANKNIKASEFSGVKHKEREDVIEEITSKQSKKNVCSICNLATGSQRGLARHMLTHTGERPYTCYICDKSFARQDKLVTHKRIHTGDKRFKCQLCDYAATDGSALRKHSQIHSDERPHKCQMCSYRARHASHMTVHLRTHTGDSPFFCKVETCGRTFKSSTDLRRHLKVHKRSKSSPSYSSFQERSEKRSWKNLIKNLKQPNKLSSCYACKDVSHTGGSRRGRSRGVRAKRVTKAYECHHCNAGFVRQDSLRSHLRLHPQTTPPHDEPLQLDEEEPEKEINASRSESPELMLPQDMCAVLLYIDNSDCAGPCTSVAGS